VAIKPGELTFSGRVRGYIGTLQLTVAVIRIEPLPACTCWMLVQYGPEDSRSSSVPMKTGNWQPVPQKMLPGVDRPALAAVFPTSAGKAAILGPLARYSELAGEGFTAEEALVEAVLDEASTDSGVEAPYLQLVLERLWEREQENGSHELRLATFRAIGGARAVVREHVQGALDALPLAEQEAAARVVRQLVTPSGRRTRFTSERTASFSSKPM